MGWWHHQKSDQWQVEWGSVIPVFVPKTQRWTVTTANSYPSTTRSQLEPNLHRTFRANLLWQFGDPIHHNGWCELSTSTNCLLLSADWQSMAVAVMEGGGEMVEWVSNNTIYSKRLCINHRAENVHDISRQFWILQLSFSQKEIVKCTELQRQVRNRGKLRISVFTFLLPSAIKTGSLLSWVSWTFAESMVVLAQNRSSKCPLQFECAPFVYMECDIESSANATLCSFMRLQLQFQLRPTYGPLHVHSWKLFCAQELTGFSMNITAGLCPNKNV